MGKIVFIHELKRNWQVLKFWHNGLHSLFLQEKRSAAETNAVCKYPNHNRWHITSELHLFCLLLTTELIYPYVTLRALISI